MPSGWRKDRLPDVVRAMASRPRHEALRGLITELLREGFGATFSELEHERWPYAGPLSPKWKRAATGLAERGARVDCFSPAQHDNDPALLDPVAA